jgi:hypothetical protein
MYDEVINPLVPRIYIVLNGNFVFDLHEIFKECNPGINKDCCTQIQHAFVII